MVLCYSNPFAQLEFRHEVGCTVGDDGCVGFVLVGEGDVLEEDVFAPDLDDLVEFELGDQLGAISILVHVLARSLQLLQLLGEEVGVHVLHGEDLLEHVGLLFLRVGRVVVDEFNHLHI